jgi:hypothetical protein
MKLVVESYELFEKMLKGSSEQDPNLEDIRHFKGSLLQFKQYWDKKAGTPAHRKVDYEYPVKRTSHDKSLPYQDFADGESALVKRNMETRGKLKGSDK